MSDRIDALETGILRVADSLEVFGACQSLAGQYHTARYILEVSGRLRDLLGPVVEAGAGPEGVGERVEITRH